MSKINHGLNSNAFNLFKMTHFIQIADEYNEQIKGVKDITINNLLTSMKSRNKQFKRELRQRLGKEFNNVFPELASERIYLYMDLLDKLVFLNEKQIKDVVDSIEIVEENSKVCTAI